MMRLNEACVIYFGVYLLTVCKGQTGQDAVQLHATLFDPARYNRRVRPVKNQNASVQVGRKLMSRVMRKPMFCICENRDADQLRGNREADQRLCFPYLDSTIPLLPKYKISSL